MAKTYKFTRTTTDKVDIKGILSEDGTTIIYVEDSIEKEIKVSDLLSSFINQPITLAVTLKSEEDLLDEQ